MISAGFQKYVEAMNQQPLDRRPERQSTGNLLPHQRRGAGSEQVAPEESKIQATTKSYDKENVDDTLQQGVSAVSPDALMKSSVLPGKNSSPGYNGWVDMHQNRALSLNRQPKPQPADSSLDQHQSHLPTQRTKQHELSQKAHTATALGAIKNGLAKSRWAGPSYNIRPVGEVRRSPPIPSTPKKNEQRDTVGKQATTNFGLNIDAPANWKTIKKPTSLAMSVASTPISQPNPLAQEYNNNHTTPNWDKPKYTHDTALGALGDTENKACTSSFQSLVAVVSVASTGDNPEATAKSAAFLPQPKELSICEQHFNDTLLDPRGNWPTGSGNQDVPSTCVANNDRDSTSRYGTQSSDNISSSPGDRIAPQHITEFIRSWIQGARVVDTTFLTQNIDHHEDCDVDTYEGRLVAPINYPNTRISKSEAFWIAFYFIFIFQFFTMMLTILSRRTDVTSSSRRHVCARDATLRS